MGKVMIAYTTLINTGMPVFSHVLVGISSQPSAVHSARFNRLERASSDDVSMVLVDDRVRSFLRSLRQLDKRVFDFVLMVRPAKDRRR